jgi:hypothetical protein
VGLVTPGLVGLNIVALEEMLIVAPEAQEIQGREVLLMTARAERVTQERAVLLMMVLVVHVIQDLAGQGEIVQAFVVN